jgi:isoquinoline 1-oxidoreductase beta subunit
MDENLSISRRTFLRTAAMVGAGLAVPAVLPGCGNSEPTPKADAPFAPNAWVRIKSDGSVIIVLDRSEMGQGVATGLLMLVAEELTCDRASNVEQAPANAAYFNPGFKGNQVTGQRGMRAAWQPMGGGAARAMPVTAASKQWGVPAELAAG